MYYICGVGLKIMHTSTDNVASIVFTSDHIVVKAGFNITFTTIEGVLSLIFVKNSLIISDYFHKSLFIPRHFKTCLAPRFTML